MSVASRYSCGQPRRAVARAWQQVRVRDERHVGRAFAGGDGIPPAVRRSIHQQQRGIEERPVVPGGEADRAIVVPYAREGPDGAA